mgnify:FL=1
MSHRMRRVRPQGAAGRASLPPTAYIRLKWFILDTRAGWRCERCRVRQALLDLDHAVLRSHGGGDSYENCSLLCRSCHNLRDLPFSLGRLEVEPQGDGRFKYVIRVGSKAMRKEIDVRWGGRPPTEAEAVTLAEIMAEARPRKRLTAQGEMS